MLSFFLSLPSELQHDILTSWLDLKDIVHLDSSCCTCERQQCLTALYAPMYLHVPARFLHVRLPGEPSDQFNPDLPAVDAQMDWVMTRSVRVASLALTQAVSTYSGFLDFLKENGVYVTRVDLVQGSTTSWTWETGAMGEVREHCPNVTELILPGNTSAADCSECARAWPRLREIYIVQAQKGVLGQIASGFRDLVAVRVQEIPGKWDDLLVELRSFFEAVNPGLRHFETGAIVASEVLEIIAARCHQLQFLRGFFPDLLDETLDSIVNGCPQLTAVDIKLGFGVTQQGISRLAQATKLTELGVGTLPGEALRWCAALRKLHIVSPDDMTQTVRLLGAHCPELREFTVTSVIVTTGGCDSAALVALAQGCPRLSNLRLDVQPADAVMVALGAHCHDLSHLSLSFTSNDTLTDVGLCALAQGCPKLRALGGIFEPPVTMVGITALATHCHHLRELQLSRLVVKPKRVKGNKLVVKDLTLLLF
jgi:hypothetical protein